MTYIQRDNILQLINHPRKRKMIKNRKGLKLFHNPQKKAVCLKILTMAPKKPNSANRRIAKVKINKQGNILTIKIM